MREDQRYRYDRRSPCSSEAGPMQFLERPMIMVSSDEQQGDKHSKSKPLYQNRGSIQSLTLVQHQRKKQINTEQVVRRFYSSQNFKEPLQPNILRKQSSNRDKQQESKLLKLFPSYKHLPISSLRHVKNQLQILSQNPKYRIQRTRNQSKQQLIIRQGQINKLTKTILFIIEQIKELDEDVLTIYQLRLRQMDSKSLQYCYKMAYQIQNSLFRSLYNKKKGNKIGVYYSDQIKMIIRQCRDRNNFKFRRFILSNKRKQELEQIIRAQDETFTCQQTKKERQLQKKQFIRESQKVNVVDARAQRIQQQQIVPPLLNSNQNQSVQKYLEISQRDKEDRKWRQRQELKGKTKAIYKKSQGKIISALKQMKQRSMKLSLLGFQGRLPLLNWEFQ